MLARLPIRKKLYVGVALLLAIVAGLSFNAYRGVYAYRNLARGISQRASEMPLAADLTTKVSDLRFVVSEWEKRHNGSGIPPFFVHDQDGQLPQRIEFSLAVIETSLQRYCSCLDSADPHESLISDNRSERETVKKIENCLDEIKEIVSHDDLNVNDFDPPSLRAAVDSLYGLTSQLPVILQERMVGLASDVRLEHRAWTTTTLATAGAAVALLGLAVFCGYRWIFQPLRVLVNGSRRVAAGNFTFRIDLATQDEMGELAAAMNGMTERFQQIRDDLDNQVRQRTKEVVRSEQLASVGFLAAGVAHEINNPLAAIAMCAESLESRAEEIIAADDEKPDGEHNEEVLILRKYLRRIQDEAFRCKGITEKLLDFSRLGDVEKQRTDLAELVTGVIDMIRHLGKYREKQIEFKASQAVVAPVNAQELKQVLLNLLTNALDSLEPQGMVTVELTRNHAQAQLVVRDNGCGMTPDVLKHLFEPFFTRRRDGQGTGLGLSITYRIVQDHGGTIEAASDGPGLGSQFRVTLPLVQALPHEKRQAA